MPADLKRLHKYMVEVEHIEVISDEMPAVVESEWPELAHKLPPKKVALKCRLIRAWLSVRNIYRAKVFL